MRMGPHYFETKPRDENEADSSLSSKYDVAYGRFELGIKNRRAPGSKTKW